MSLTHIFSYASRQEFWWSLEDDVEFDCADKAALLEKARQHKLEALQRQQEVCVNTHKPNTREIRSKCETPVSHPISRVLKRTR